VVKARCRLLDKAVGPTVLAPHQATDPTYVYINGRSWRRLYRNERAAARPLPTPAGVAITLFRNLSLRTRRDIMTGAEAMAIIGVIDACIGIAKRSSISVVESRMRKDCRPCFATCATSFLPSKKC